MSKRKRTPEAFEKPEIRLNDSEEHLRNHRQLATSTLEQYEKTLFRALRLARGFERQKLGRRQKTAKQAKDEVETARMNAEVAALKALNLPQIAQLHLYKSLLRSKPMSAAPAFPSYITAKIEAASRLQDVASLNVQARLFNSNPVKTTVVEILNSIASLLGVPNGTVSGKKGRLRASDIVRGGDSTKNEVSKPGVITGSSTNRVRNTSQTTTSPAIDASDSDENIHPNDNESDDYDAFASRLGSSSDDLSADENEVQNSLRDKLKPSQRSSRAASVSSSGSSSYSASANPHSNRRPFVQNTIRTSTTFLPSLTLGGFISDSNSDHSSPSRGGPTASQPRKNRRGQQARRQIWEKKYGQNARHLQRQARNQDRDQGWDPKAGARPAAFRGREGGRGWGRGRGSERDPDRRRTGKAGPLSSGANADPVNVRGAPNGESKGKQAKGEGPLHPSWEAAKKAKEATRNVAFQGKKLVFD